MFDDINGIETIMCPYCKEFFYLNYYEQHLEKCNSIQAKIKCQICFKEIHNNSDDEGYLEHLLSCHDEFEIKNKIKNKNILNFLGIQLEEIEIISEQKNFVSLNKSNHNTNNFVSNLNQIQNNFNNKPNSSSKNLFQKISINSKNYVTQCKFCENVVINKDEILRGHLENFHNCINLKEALIKSNFGISFEFIQMQTYSICPQCGILIDDLDFLQESHLKVFHRTQHNLSKDIENNLNNLSNFSNHLTNKNNLINYFYCHLCEKPLESNQDEIQHIHSSFINLKTNPNDLLFFLNDNLAYENSKISNNSNSNKKIKKNFLNTPIFQDFIKNQEINLQENEENPFSNMKTKSKFQGSLNTSIFQPTITNNPDTKHKILNPYINNQIEELNQYNPNLIKIDKEYDKKFSDIFRSKIFDYVDILGRNDTTHFFHKSKTASSAFLLKRLKNEFEKLQADLPCNYSSSFFIRADMDHPQYIKLLIAGSRGTPYEHGLFEFDIFIPNNYPKEAPKCQFITTGNSKIRFNPNLYLNGYVCLSLLGTWEGTSVEKWDPQDSNLLQLILSLSSLVMNEKVILNEPGYANPNVPFNDESSQMNEGYCNVIKYGSLLYAMIEMLKSPLPIFKEIIIEYFKFKDKEMLSDLHKWIERAKNVKYSYSKINSCHNPAICEILKSKGFENLIELHLKELKQLLTSLKSFK